MGVVNSKVKSMFFDRQAVIDAMDRGTAEAITKAAFSIRLIAKRSMRWRKNPRKPSPAGTPPFAHAGQMRDLLYATFDIQRRNSWIGPVPWSKGEAPQLNEFGGSVGRRGFTYGKRTARNPNPGKSARNYTARYPKRPFMGPALKIVAPRFPGMFEGTVHN